jgi:hypothetical protein
MGSNGLGEIPAAGPGVEAWMLAAGSRDVDVAASTIERAIEVPVPAATT